MAGWVREGLLLDIYVSGRRGFGVVEGYLLVQWMGGANVW